MADLTPGDIVRTPDGQTALVIGVDLVGLMVRDGTASYYDVKPAADLTVIPPDPGDTDGD